MNLLIYILVGALVGYLASRIMNTNNQQGFLLDVVVGIVGAFIAGVFISPLLGIGTINEGISFLTILVSLVGAIILLWIVKLVRR